MGRRSNSKNKRQKTEGDKPEQKKQQHSRPKKKQKRERFWIEDCRTPSNITKKPSLEVLITQVQLYDDYRQVPQLQEPANDQVKENVTEKAEENVSSDATLSNMNNAKKTQTDTNSEVNTENKTNDTLTNKTTPQVQTTPDDNKESTNSHAKGAANNEIISGEKNSPAPDFSDAFIAVKRSKSAMKPMLVADDSVENFQPLPNGDCGDGITNPFPKEEVPDKFWSQRRRLFTLFDNGIQLDPESWYSVTPEAIANHISSHLAGSFESAVVLDAFCGCGGNAIAFARMDEVKLVVCVDKDLAKLKMAAMNASIYNIPQEKMIFVHNNAARVFSMYENKKRKQGITEGDRVEPERTKEGFLIGDIDLLPETIDCIFLSPPWGGMDYGKVGKRNYTLRCIHVDGIERDTSIDGDEVLKQAASALGREGPIALFLPRNINGISLGRSVLRAGYDSPMVMEKNVLNGKLKTVTAYIGL